MELRTGVHLSAEVLQAFSLGKLDDITADVVVNHLETCSACRQKAAAMSSDDFLNRLRDAHSRSGTPAPAKLLSGVPQSVPPSQSPSSTKLPMTSLPPELAGHPQYEIVRELGRGGMGVVYLAKNRLLGRQEVLKVVNKALLERPGVAERFLREIQSAGLLNHPNVVTAYNALEIGGSLAFAMEYVEGQDLAQVIKERGPLAVGYACHYMREAALGLHHAFEKKMVHRDIKPQNLILARDGPKHIVKVLDFGLAKVMRENRESHGLTGSGVMMGTPDYMAPEQIQDAASADIRADIYSLGCTLYHLLAGTPPFSGRGLYEILQAHHSMEAKSLNLARPEVPAELAAVVRKMMAKKPEDRYQTPMQVAQALMPFIKQKMPGVPGGATIAQQFGVSKPVKVEAKGKKKESTEETVNPFKDLGSTSVEVRKARAAQNKAPVAKRWSKKWLIGIGAAGVALVMLAGLSLGLWAAGVLKVKTKDGTIVLENLPADAEVTVDGGTISVKSSDGKTFEVRVDASKKKHRVEVQRDGFKTFGEEVEVDAGGRKSVVVRLESLPPKAGDVQGPKAPKVDAGAQQIASQTLPSLKLLRIPAKGKTFTMGSPPEEKERGNDETQHEVTLSADYYLGVTTVTRGQFAASVKDDGYQTEAEKAGKENTWHNPGFEQTDDHSVVKVSHSDALAFCAWLTKKDGRAYALPTEAQWEYACRAGTQTAYSFGDDPKLLGDYAWFSENSKTRTHAVAAKKANPWGLYDMHGNVWQWCADRYGKYPEGAVTDPQGPTTGSSHVMRGGGFEYALYCRSAKRNWYVTSSHANVGFRVAVPQ